VGNNPWPSIVTSEDQKVDWYDMIFLKTLLSLGTWIIKSELKSLMISIVVRYWKKSYRTLITYMFPYSYFFLLIVLFKKFQSKFPIVILVRVVFDYKKTLVRYYEDIREVTIAIIKFITMTFVLQDTQISNSFPKGLHVIS